MECRKFPNGNKLRLYDVTTTKPLECNYTLLWAYTEQISVELLDQKVQGIGDKYWIITNSQAVIHRKSLSIVDLIQMAGYQVQRKEKVRGRGSEMCSSGVCLLGKSETIRSPN